jgi:hypothetical protein
MFIKNILTKEKKHEFRGYNYLEDANISNYFKADEYFSYYKSQIHVAPRRDISEEILSHNITFLFSLIDEDICKKIDNVIKDSIFNQTIDIKTNINNSAKAINHQGYKLLEIKDNLTPDYLQSCFINAAKKHHTDVGGKKEDMQIINEARGQFRNLLKTYLLGVGEDGGDSLNATIIKSVEEFRFLLANQLLEICVDVFCVDKGLEIFDYINDSLLTTKRYEDYFFDLNNGNINQLAILLFKANMKEQANKILKVLIKIGEPKVKKRVREWKLGPRCLHGKRVTEEEIRERWVNGYYGDCEKKIKGQRKIRITINHQVQVNHAYRLGIIDQEKYHNLSEKFQDKKDANYIIQNKLDEYAKSEGFLEDLKVYKIPKGIPNKRMIPSAGYYSEMFTNLTEDQKIEYVNAFKSPIKLELIKKYLYTRMMSYVLSLIQNFDDQFLTQKVIKECKILAETLNQKNGDILLIMKFFNYLNSLDSKERQIKLDYLINISSKNETTDGYDALYDKFNFQKFRLWCYSEYVNNYHERKD